MRGIFQRECKGETTRARYGLCKLAGMEPTNHEMNRAESRVTELTGKLAEYKHKIQNAPDEVKHLIHDLEQKAGSYRTRLEELRQAGGDAWEDAKVGLEIAANDLSDAWESIRSRFEHHESATEH